MKKLLASVPLIVLLCCVWGCQDQAAMAELEAFRDQAEVEEANTTLVNTVFQALNEHNAEVWDDHFAPDYLWYFPSGNPEPLDRDGEREFVKAIWTAFSNDKWNIDEIYAVQDRVFVKFSFTATHTGEFQGIPATGNGVSGTGMWIAEIENGKLVEAREEYDFIGMMQQLGMELKPKE